jgi:hypothetical protein
MHGELGENFRVIGFIGDKSYPTTGKLYHRLQAVDEPRNQTPCAKCGEWKRVFEEHVS